MSVREAADACARGLQDKEFARRLRAAIPTLERNSEALQHASNANELHTVTSETYAVGELSDSEMKALYRGHLGRSSSRASRVRGALLAAAPHNRCCYCFQGLAKTLDHFVPQASVPALAIDPWNLIPACSDCNRELLDSYGSTPEEQLLHPYAMPDIGRWLRAKVVAGGQPSLHFWADPDPALDTELRQRIKHEFSALNLAQMFATVSAAELIETNVTLDREYGDDQAELVQAHLLEASSDALQVDPNNRRGVFFEALAESDWYCEGGFRRDLPAISAEVC